MPKSLSPDPHWVAQMNWAEIKRKINTDVCALLPVGAAAKEHGLHLPMNTDYLQAQWLADQMSAKKNLLTWPIVSYGYYPAFVEYYGSITLAEQTYSALIKDIITSIFNSGIQKLVVLNTGISTIKPLKLAVGGFSGNAGLINVYSGAKFNQTISNSIEQEAGGHGDEVETSIMLAIDPSLVNMDKASGSIHACSTPGTLRRVDTTSVNYSPSGACGAPQHATAEKGLNLLKAMLEDISNQWSEFESNGFK